MMAVEVDYRFPPGIDAHQQAKVIAIGQTAGTWDARFSHRQASLEAHLAQVVEVRSEASGHCVATALSSDELRKRYP